MLSRAVFAFVRRCFLDDDDESLLLCSRKKVREEEEEADTEAEVYLGFGKGNRVHII